VAATKQKEKGKQQNGVKITAEILLFKLHSRLLLIQLIFSYVEKRKNKLSPVSFMIFVSSPISLWSPYSFPNFAAQCALLGHFPLTSWE